MFKNAVLTTLVSTVHANNGLSLRILSEDNLPVRALVSTNLSIGENWQSKASDRTFSFTESIDNLKGSNEFKINDTN